VAGAVKRKDVWQENVGGDFPLPLEAYDEFLRGYRERAYGRGMAVGIVYRVPGRLPFVLNDKLKRIMGQPSARPGIAKSSSGDGFSSANRTSCSQANR